MFVAALLVRGGWGTLRLIRADDPFLLEFPDEQQYWSMAASLRDGSGLKDELGFQATRMPLYPAALSLAAGSGRGILVAKAMQWMVGALVAVLTAGAATTLFDRRVGLVAGLLVAFDPFLAFFSSLLLTETPFVAALVALWWILAPSMRTGAGSPGRWVVVGLIAALTVYLRESALGLVVLVLGLVVMFRRFDRRVLSGAAIAGGFVLVALVPLAARNQRVTGEWYWLTTRGGISLYDGVGPCATGASNLGNIKQMPAVRGLSEAKWNRWFLDQSFDAIKGDPGRILRLAGVKLARMWNPFPNVETYQSRLVRVVSAAWTLPTFACAMVGALLLLIRNKKDGVRIALFLLLPAVYLSVLHSLFIGSVRYRLGAIPMLEILAAVAFVAMLDRVREKRATREGALAD
ncbi:MAG: glycosyltransferase family 39 protein [Phycisphaerae bacterium]